MSNKLNKPIKAGTKFYGVSYVGRPTAHGADVFNFMAHRRGYQGSYTVADGLGIVWLYNSVANAENALKKALANAIAVYDKVSAYTMQESGHLLPDLTFNIHDVKRVITKITEAESEVLFDEQE